MSEDHNPITGEIIEQPRLPMSPMRPNLMPVNALVGSTEMGLVWSAIIAAQQEMRQPKRTKKADIRSRDPGKQGYSYKYAPIEEITKVLKPVLIPNGLWYQQGLVYRGPQAFIRTVVYHQSGQWAATDYPVFAASATPREFAGAVTQACRRGLMLAFGITPEDDNEETLPDAEARARPPRRAAQTRAAAPPLNASELAYLSTRAWEEADKGYAEFSDFYMELDDADRLGLRPEIESLKKHARAKDAQHAQQN